MYNRAIEWEDFSDKVLEHIVTYATPQYGDAPNDMASSFTKADFDKQIAKYATRQINGGNHRGPEDNLRDYLKIAHYACMAYFRHKQNLDAHSKGW